jgi:hypothetical protein
MHTGLVPVADLKRTSLKPFKPPKPNFPHITTDMVDGDDLPDLAWPEELGIDIP